VLVSKIFKTGAKANAMTTLFNTRDLEVSGSSAKSIVEAFKSFTLLSSQLLLAEKIGRPGPNGTVVVDAEWYPFDALMRVLKKIESSVGEATLFQVGLSASANAAFPPNITDLLTSMRTINVAYHLNHRRQGKPMVDPVTGAVDGGIGDYVLQEGIAGGIHLLCTSPYPCAFDRGIITGLGSKFAPQVILSHEPSGRCRAKGADSCRYLIKT
jgi:hypothetical protein